MQTIRCAACGERYDYRLGCCPRCGADTAHLDGEVERRWLPYTTGRDVH